MDTNKDATDAPEEEECDVCVMENKDALEVIYNWFTDFAYHHMIGIEDINTECRNEFLNICEITVMDTTFALQVALDETLVFRVVILLNT